MPGRADRVSRGEQHRAASGADIKDPLAPAQPGASHQIPRGGGKEVDAELVVNLGTPVEHAGDAALTPPDPQAPWS